MSDHLGLVYKVLFLMPAFVANASPLVTKSFLKKRHPVDFGKNFIDGRRIFGDNKSWEGVIIGILVGTAVGTALTPLYGCHYIKLVVAGFMQGVGSMIGDLVNSFLKRRLGINPGGPLPFLDQTSFIVTSLLILKSVRIDKLVGLDLGLVDMAIIVGIALVLHPLTNYIAYLLGLKEVPY
ncbi:MAG: CDP-2,3-bis-(O-geranylgeranyl)-sn-glycerol synthase [Sulfolobales archaeon]